jgi:hypothetical protein
VAGKLLPAAEGFARHAAGTSDENLGSGKNIVAIIRSADQMKLSIYAAGLFKKTMIVQLVYQGL